jgi:predicted metal-dependent phosphoesterase TrpH
LAELSYFFPAHNEAANLRGLDEEALETLPVLAHPAEVIRLHSLLPDLMAAGLVGMECYYSEYSPEIVEGLVAVADEHGLIPTGGTDFHWHDSTGHGPKHPGESWVPWESVRRLRAKATRVPLG